MLPHQVCKFSTSPSSSIPLVAYPCLKLPALLHRSIDYPAQKYIMSKEMPKNGRSRTRDEKKQVGPIPRASQKKETASPRRKRAKASGTVSCSEPGCHEAHFGAWGAAGLLLVRHQGDNPGGAPTHVVMQHRSFRTAHGGTWALPGGGIDEGETPAEAALREAEEEVGLPAGCAAGEAPLVVIRLATALYDHGSWKYTTVVADVTAGASWLPVRPWRDTEGLAVEWVAIDQVEKRPLHPGFRSTWPRLRAMVEELARSQRRADALTRRHLRMIQSDPHCWWDELAMSPAELEPIWAS